MKINWTQANNLSIEHGDSFFIFDEEKFIDNFKKMQSAFNSVYSNTRIAYSYKTNYTPYICKIVNELGGYAEVVSEMEFCLAKKIGVPYDKIIYNGPNKSIESLKESLLNGVIVNIESMRDFRVVQFVANEYKNSTFKISLRLNFELTDFGESRFGIDTQGEDFIFIKNGIDVLSNVHLAGLHCHFPNRDLNSFSERCDKLIALIPKFFEKKNPEFLNIGGGFFSEMPDSLKGKYAFEIPDFFDYAEIIGRKLDMKFSTSLAKPILFLEPGTALVANTFDFITKIINIRKIRNRLIANVDGSIFNISPSARSTNLPVSAICKNVPNDSREFDIAGFTCIEGDYLSKNFKADLNEDDFLKYSNVGSYSIVMKPPFILPNVAILIKNQLDNNFTIIKHRESFDYIFQNFIWG